VVTRNVPWVDEVRRTRELLIFRGRSVQSAWQRPLERAVHHLNVLSQRMGFGVRFALTDQAPPEDSLSGANVQLEIGTSATVRLMGLPVSATVGAAGVHGRIVPLLRPGRRSGLTKALILLPPRPQSGGRAAGDGVRLVIAAHELVHAAGFLDHSSYSDNDLMNEFLTISSGGRSRPQDDTLETQNNRGMPPIWISANTASALQRLWP
jgi:hypothetical protein